jgi:hypothetical protein
MWPTGVVALGAWGLGGSDGSAGSAEVLACQARPNCGIAAWTVVESEGNSMGSTEGQPEQAGLPGSQTDVVCPAEPVAVALLRRVCFWAHGFLEHTCQCLKAETTPEDPVARSYFVNELCRFARECKRGLELVRQADCLDSRFAACLERTEVACSEADRFSDHLFGSPGRTPPGNFVRELLPTAEGLRGQFGTCKKEIEVAFATPGNVDYRLCVEGG